MSTWNIDRLALRLSSVSEAQAREIADKVARALSRALANGAAPPDSVRVDTLRLSVPTTAPLSTMPSDSLGDRIAAEVARALLRTL